MLKSFYLLFLHTQTYRTQKNIDVLV